VAIREVKGNLRFPLDFTYHGCPRNPLADNALVALTLLIAESRKEEKKTIVKVIVNLINQRN